jgi:23S rRNA (cytosine1962-C5)-methyltransferase
MNGVLVPEKWRDYELIDSGEGKKLERWGQYIIARPDARIVWKKGNNEVWGKADATYDDTGWKFKEDPPTKWQINYDGIKFILKPTDFKHTGVFPEQAANWEWIRENSRRVLKCKVLNLFAYTGGATMAAALGGAFVTHVDSSRPAMMWASENAKITGVGKEAIRWIQEDALKFVQREIRRGVKYDGIIMDPPKFGRGASGEVWKLEDNLPKLVSACKELLSPTPLFFLINAYTADMSHIALGNLLSGVLGANTDHGEIGLRESERGYILPAGIFARWDFKN